MRTTTKDHILACGGAIIHHKGYTATGLQEILQAAGVPKGSFYFYFKSKEDFGLALVEYYQNWFGAQVRPILKNGDLPPLERLAAFFCWFRQYFADEGYIKGCPIGNLIQEMGDVNLLFREKLNASLTNLISFVTKLLEEAQANGQLLDQVDAAAMAGFIISAWQGALIRMKAVAGPEPLDNFQAMVFEVLLAAA